VLVRRCSLYCWRRDIRVRRLLLCFRWRTKHAARKRDRASGQSCRSGHSSPGSIGLCGHLLVVAARPQANQFGGRRLSPVMRNYKGHPSQGRPDRPGKWLSRAFRPRSTKVPRLHLDGVDVKIRDVDVPHLVRTRRQVPLVRRETAAVPYLIAASVRQRKPTVPLADAGEIIGQIGQLVGDEMDHRAFALDLSAHRHHAGRQYDDKFLAKLASDHRKPNGQYTITPEMGPAFVEALSVGKFHAIGPATSAKMNSLGLYTGLDMRNQLLEFMQANFGKAGAYYYWISRGVDNREVRANRIRKSVGAENTFSGDLTDFDTMVTELQPLIDKVWRHCEEKGSRGRTVTLKVKFADFELITRSRTLPASVDSCPNLESVTLDLLRLVFPLEKAIRLLGVSVSGFVGDDESNHSEQIALEL
jgi:hypothetical protein